MRLGRRRPGGAWWSDPQYPHHCCTGNNAYLQQVSPRSASISLIIRKGERERFRGCVAMLEVIDVGKCTDGRATPVPIVDIAGQEDSAGIGTSRDGTERDRTVRLGGHRVCAARPGHPGNRLGRAGLWVSGICGPCLSSVDCAELGGRLLEGPGGTRRRRQCRGLLRACPQVRLER